MNKIMENNETVVEETTDASTEDVNIEAQEETVESLKGQVAKYKAIADRKEKKLQSQNEEVTINKTNTEQTGLSREEAIFFAQGGDEADLALAKKIASIEGIGILAAKEDSVFKAKVAERLEEAKIKANSMGASNGSEPMKREKDVNTLSPEEHRAYAAEKYGMR